MTDFSNALNTSVYGMRAQSVRIGHLAENIANADTPGYHRKLVSFDTVHDGMVQAGPVRTDNSMLQDIHDPSHPLADESGYYKGSNVNLMTEIADARQANRSYEANLKMFEQIKSMSGSLMELLRK